MRLRLALTLIILLCFASHEANATTVYHVRVKPASATGLTARIALDLTSSDSLANQARILDFAHDGTAQPIVIEGGPVSGALLFGENPADTTTVEDDFFFNEIAVPFAAFGTQATFTLELTETAPTALGPPDEASFYPLRSYDLTAYPTADDLGADALFAICITANPGGDLSVFSPMTFIAPDTLALEGAIVGVPHGSGPVGRLQFRAVAPNPSLGGVRLVYEVPQPGGRLRIKVYDVAGRLVAEPFRGQRAPGIWDTQWDATDSRGRAVPAGVYVVQLQMAGQSLVRRVVLAR